MTGERFAIIPTGLYEVDPALAESVAREFGMTLIVRDQLFTADEMRLRDVCAALSARADLYQAPDPRVDFVNRAERRSAGFARRTNSAGWKT